MPERSITEQVREYLEEGHDHETIRDHLQRKGLQGEAVEEALRGAPARSLKKHPAVHIAIIVAIGAGVIAIAALFIVFGGRAKVAPGISALLADIEEAAEGSDGGAYFALLSPALRNDACLRWQAAQDTFGSDGSTCLQAMDTFYSSQLQKFFGGSSPDFRIASVTEHDGLTTLIATSRDREFRLIIEESGGKQYLASDVLLDASITETAG